MRWLVEVMPLGKTEKEALYVDAESWQKALQVARAQRGEAGPMSGFSIELLEQGCSAVDPSSRLRYEVRRAPDEAATRVPTARPPLAAPVGGVSSPRPSQAPRPMSQPPPPSRPVRPSQPPHASKRPSLSPGALSAIGQASTAVQPAGATPSPPPVIAAAPSVAPLPPASGTRVDVALNIPSQVIFKREHDPTESVPLTYREYVFLVPPATTEGAAQALLETQLELVVASLARVPAGKLVNLAVFDVAFKGKPAVPPLTTLMWKDWRGAPIIEFPRRPGYVRRRSAPPPAVVAPPAPAPSQSPPPMARSESAAPPAATPIAVAAPQPPQPLQQPTPAVPAPPVVAPPRAIPAVVAPPPAIGSPSFAAPSPAIQPMTMPRQAAPSPPPQPRARMRGEDLIADLFESMHDLHFLRDAVEGGDFCLSLAMEKIPSQTGIVHLYDIDRREYLVTSARGIAADVLLLRRHTEGDVLLSAAMHKQRAVVLADATQSDATALERYDAIGGARSLMVAPVMQSGRFLGAIELLNPLDGQPYTETDGNALTYIAEQFAEFVANRGIVTDPQRIRPHAS